MDVSPSRLARIILPRLPQILSIIVLSKLSLSPNSDKQDTIVETVVFVIRLLVTQKRPLKYVQDLGSKDVVVKGNKWISKVNISAPDAYVRDAVIRGIKILGDGTEKYVLPDVADVGAEWTGFREDARKNSPRPDEDEGQQYENLMKEVTSPVTVLYFHGGAYFMMDPASHRDVTSQLAKKTGGRCLSVRYRLAPQNPFPAALLDALTAYLYLLSPPEGSYHLPVPAQNIVLSGDSAGGNLAAVLGLLLLTLQKAGVESIPFHGKDVPVQLPAGMALNSPWCDIGRSLPSLWKNAKYDYLDPPSATGLPDDSFPADEIWPAKPPRAEIYCQASLLTHPLVSPITATSEQWAGAPPTFICGGSEGLVDEYTVMARRIFNSGAAVDFVGYEGMPHCFAMVFPMIAPAKDCFERWAQFCNQAIAGKVERKTDALWMTAFSQPPVFYPVSLGEAGLSDQDVQEMMSLMKSRALDREAAALKEWEASNKAKL